MKTETNIFRVYDSSFWVDIAPAGPPARPLYHRLNNLLQERGWKIGPDPFQEKPNPRSWSWQRLLAVKGDLYCAVEVRAHEGGGGKIAYQFWQDLVLEEGRTCGRWSFDKRQRMPFLIRMQWQATLNVMQTLLRSLGFTHEITSWEAHEQKGMDFILKRMAESCHTPKDYDPLTHTSPYSYNVQGRDGQPIQPGRKYMAYVNGRLVTGTAYYNLNNMWWLLPNEQSRPFNVGSHHLFPPDATLPRRQPRAPAEALQIIQRRYEEAQRRKQWKRCQQFSDYLEKKAA